MNNYIDNFGKNINGNYRSYSNSFNHKNVIEKKSCNCYDKALQYKDIDDSLKESFIVACMKIVLENWSEREVLIELQNELYGFDLVGEFNSLFY